MSFQNTNYHNKIYPALDLFNNDIFYDSFSPIVVTINSKESPVFFDYNNQRYVRNKFIVNKFIAEQLIKHNQEIVSNGGNEITLTLNTSFSTIKIPFKDIEFSLTEQDKNKTLKVINSEGSPFLLIYKDLTMNVDSIYKSLNLLSYMLHALKNGMSPSVFIEKNTESMNGATLKGILEKKAFLQTVKEHHPKEYFSLIRHICTQYSKDIGIFLYNHRLNQSEPDWVTHEKKKNQSNILNILDSNELFLHKDALMAIKAQIIFSFYEKKEVVDLSITQYLSSIPKEEIDTLCNILDKKSPNLGAIFKKEAEEYQKFQLQGEDDFFEEVAIKHVSKICISWQKICLNKFPNILTRLDTPSSFYDDMKVYRDNLSDVYNNGSTSALKEIFKYLEIAQKVLLIEFNKDIPERPILVNDSQGKPLPPSRKIYLTNKGLFFEIQMDNDYPKEKAKIIIKKVIDGISVEGINNPEYIISKIEKIILEEKLLDTPSQKDEPLTTTLTPFKM